MIKDRKVVENSPLFFASLLLSCWKLSEVCLPGKRLAAADRLAHRGDRQANSAAWACPISMHCLTQHFHSDKKVLQSQCQD